MESGFKTVAALGQTQHGKSSFLNLISASDALKVGQGDGRSCTSRIEPLRFPDWLRLFGEDTEIRCFEIPGLDDTYMRFTTEDIKRDVKIALTGLGSRQLDALLIVQSMAEATISLRTLFDSAEAIFGPNVLQCAIVILTKSDTPYTQAVVQKTRMVEELCGDKGVPYVRWVNGSWENGQVSFNQLASQAIQLRAAFSQIETCEVMDGGEFERVSELQSKETVAKAKTTRSRKAGNALK